MSWLGHALKDILGRIESLEGKDDDQLMAVLNRIARGLDVVAHEVRKLDRHLHPHHLTVVTITQGATNMGSTSNTPSQTTLAGLAPGSSGTLTANLFDASGNPITTLPSGASVAWESSDPTNIVFDSPNSLQTGVAVPSTDQTSEAATVTVTITNADGSTVSSGAVAFPITFTPPPPPPPVNVASVTITQS